MRTKNIFSDTDRNIAKRIKLRRIMLGMTQSDLSRLCGVSFQQIQKYETAKNRISCSRLFQISLILKVPVEFFFENTNQMYKNQSLKLLILYWNLPKNLRKNTVLKLIEQIK